MNTRGRLWGAKGKFGALLCPASSKNRPIGQKRLPVKDLAALILSLVCSAVLLGAAIESRNHPWVAWIGLTPLFLVIRSLSPLKAMSCGALWGFCLFALLNSGNGVVAAPLDGSFVLLILIPASYTFGAAHLTRRIGFNPLFLAFGWVGVEFVLRPFGLISGLLTSVQGNEGIIHRIAMLLGYMFVVFFIAFVNAKMLTIQDWAIIIRAGFLPALRPDDLPKRLPIMTRRLVPQVFHSMPNPRGPPRSGCNPHTQRMGHDYHVRHYGRQDYLVRRA